MRSRSERIFLKLSCPVKYSIRKMGQISGVSKSAVHRQKNAIEKRNLFPESYFWETREGIAFLSRLFVGVLFVFGIKNGIGTGTISEYFKLLRIDTHVGSCPTTIEKKLQKSIVALALLKELGKNVVEQESIISQLKKEQGIVDSGIRKYWQILHALSKTVHPFDIDNSNPQSSMCVKLLLNQLVEEIIQLQKEQEINDPKNRIEKFRKQIEGIASLIDAWWLWVEESLDSIKLTEEVPQWLLACLLPAVYWEKQTARTKAPDLKEIYLTA